MIYKGSTPVRPQGISKIYKGGVLVYTNFTPYKWSKDISAYVTTTEALDKYLTLSTDIYSIISGFGDKSPNPHNYLIVNHYYYKVMKKHKFYVYGLIEHDSKSAYKEDNGSTTFGGHYSKDNFNFNSIGYNPRNVTYEWTDLIKIR